LIKGLENGSRLGVSLLASRA